MEKEIQHFALERTGHPRFLVELPIQYRRTNEFELRSGHAVNFSGGGLIVHASEAIEIGEKLEMKAYVSSDLEWISVRAVVQAVCADTQVKEDEYYRFGISYVILSPEHMARLKGFLRQYGDPRALEEIKPSFSGCLIPSKSSVPKPSEGLYPLPIQWAKT